MQNAELCSHIPLTKAFPLRGSLQDNNRENPSKSLPLEGKVGCKATRMRWNPPKGAIIGKIEILPKKEELRQSRILIFV